MVNAVELGRAKSKSVMTKPVPSTPHTIAPR
jgi:hypothetical protein